MTAHTTAPRSVRVASATAFIGLLRRDFRVVRRERGAFLVRTVSQPVLLVFVFTYVFPRIGQELRAFGGDANFTDVLVPGVLAIALLIKGIQVVALPLVAEFGYTREIEDRVMAPLPVWGVAVEKIIAAAIQGIVAAFVVFPIALLLPAQTPAVRVSWLPLLAVLLLGALLAGALGLALGTLVEPNQVPLMFSIVILPVTFLGATYYPWSQLDAIPWLQYATLVNPLVYISEGFRMALTPQFPHMHPLGIFSGLVGLTLAFGAVGITGFRRRVLG
jgi:ABC-2 type transport system permease protein